MQSNSELRAAGQRAASQPVPAPPPVAQLQSRAAKHRTKRRVVGSGIAALAMVAVSLPIALNVGGSTTVQNVVAGTGQTAPAAQAESAAMAQDEGDPAEPSAPNESSGVQIELRTGDDFSLAINVISGDGASEAANAAAAAAEETLDVDGVTVWVTNDGDQTTVAALVEPDEFVQATGSADQLDKLIEALRNGGIDNWQAFSGFGNDFFDWSEDGWGHNGSGDADFEFNFDFESGDGMHPDLEEFLERRFGGDFAELEDLLNNLDIDIEGLDDLDRDLGDLDRFLEEGLPQLEQFFNEGDFGHGFGAWGENFDGCISIQGDENFRFEYPKGCSAAG